MLVGLPAVANDVLTPITLTRLVTLITWRSARRRASPIAKSRDTLKSTVQFSSWRSSIPAGDVSVPIDVRREDADVVVRDGIRPAAGATEEPRKREARRQQHRAGDVHRVPLVVVGGSERERLLHRAQDPASLVFGFAEGVGDEALPPVRHALSAAPARGPDIRAARWSPAPESRRSGQR